MLKRKLMKFLRQRGIEVRRACPRGQEQFPEYIDTEFVDSYRRYFDRTLVPWSGLYSAYQAAKYVAQNDIAGDIVECGVWRGGCALIMADALHRFGDTKRTIYLYDTFAGMSEPTEIDRKTDKIAINSYRKHKRDTFVDWCYAPLQDVEDGIAQSPYPNFKLVKGKVEDTIPGLMPEKISLLRIDTDFYESTRHELEHLYPLLSERGVFIADDYAAWAGARKAIQEYFHDSQMLFHLDYSYGAIAGVKVS